MGALALRRRRLNWGLNFNNRCCVRPCLSQSAATDDADVHSLAREILGGRGGGGRVSSRDPAIFIGCQILASPSGWNICCCLTRGEQNKRPNVWTGVSRSISSGQMRTPVGRRPLLSTSGTSSARPVFRGANTSPQWTHV